MFDGNPKELAPSSTKILFLISAFDGTYWEIIQIPKELAHSSIKILFLILAFDGTYWEIIGPLKTWFLFLQWEKYFADALGTLTSFLGNPFQFLKE